MRCPKFPLFLLLISAAFSLQSCDSGKETPEVKADPKREALNKMPGVRAIKLADLVEHDNGTFTHNGELFSGRAVKLAEDNSRIFEKHFWKGKLHGSAREFYTDGTLKIDMRYEGGLPNGITIDIDPNGKRTEIYYENGVEVERYGPEEDEDEDEDAE